MAFSCGGNMYAALGATTDLVGSSSAVGPSPDIDGFGDNETNMSVPFRPCWQTSVVTDECLAGVSETSLGVSPASRSRAEQLDLEGGVGFLEFVAGISAT